MSRMHYNNSQLVDFLTSWYAVTNPDPSTDLFELVELIEQIADEKDDGADLNALYIRVRERVYHAIRDAISDAGGDFYNYTNRRAILTCIVEAMVVRSSTKSTSLVLDTLRQELGTGTGQHYCNEDIVTMCQISSQPMTIMPGLSALVDQFENYTQLRAIPSVFMDVLRLNFKPHQAFTPAVPPAAPKPTEEWTMNPSNRAVEAVTKQTLIYGQEASQVTDTEIVNLIADIETEIDTLNKIKNKPKSLKKRINALEKNIEALVKLSDDRNTDSEK